MVSARLLAAATSLLDACRARGWMPATAENCTGGLITAALTVIAGSSGAVDCGFVTYSNEAKMALLGVPGPLIPDHGAISEPVARGMAEGGLARSRATITVAVTGVADPRGGSVEKPVGLALFGLAQRSAPVHSARTVYPGDRAAVREASVAHAFELICFGT